MIFLWKANFLKRLTLVCRSKLQTRLVDSCEVSVVAFIASLYKLFKISSSLPIESFFFVRISLPLPSGKLRILLCISAASAASSTSTSSASWFPYRMLYRMSWLNSTVSCGTTPICFWRETCVTWTGKSNKGVTLSLQKRAY